MNNTSLRAASQPLAAVLLTSSLLLAADPPAPPGGFPIQTLPDQLITYADGYRTMLDIRAPSTAAPATGWPCLMVVHGGGGSRKRAWVMAVADQMARAGYVTLAYDTSGNGATLTLNPPGTRPEALRIRDIVEIFARSKALLGARMDFSRLAVFGKSGGGKHALWAAAYSERFLPPPVNNARMPKILAVHSDIQVLDFVSDKLPGDNTIQAEFAVSTFDRLGPADPMVQHMVNGNYGALRSWLASDPATNFFPLLRQSDVPLMVSYSFDDKNHSPNVNGDAFAQLKPGVPRRYLQITGGHDTAENGIETATRRDYLRRWCDRFLKNIQTGVVAEPFAEIGVLPSAPADYLSASTEWKHRRTDTWPIVGSRRLYLRGNGSLQPNAPASIEAGPTVRHRVSAGYGMLQFMAQKAAPANVMAQIPLDSKEFDLAPVTEPMELVGRAVVELDVINTTPDFQLSAALYDVPPAGPARFITSGTAALLNKVPSRHRMHVELDDVGYVLEQGHRLRLVLQNLSLRRQPGNAHIYIAPYFASCDLDVQIDPAFAPRVDLPISPAGASLTPRFARVRASTGINFDLKVHGETSRALGDYLVLVSGSGTAPGLNLPPRVPINFDVFTAVGIDAVNGAVFQNFFGQLNAQGRGRATLVVPAFIANLLAGQRLSFAVVGRDVANNIFVSNPVEMIIEP